MEKPVAERRQAICSRFRHDRWGGIKVNSWEREHAGHQSSHENVAECVIHNSSLFSQSFFTGSIWRWHGGFAENDERNAAMIVGAPFSSLFLFYGRINCVRLLSLTGL